MKSFQKKSSEKGAQCRTKEEKKKRGGGNPISPWDLGKKGSDDIFQGTEGGRSFATNMHGGEGEKEDVPSHRKVRRGGRGIL